jgi:hypothetical protein
MPLVPQTYNFHEGLNELHLTQLNHWCDLTILEIGSIFFNCNQPRSFQQHKVVDHGHNKSVFQELIDQTHKDALILLNKHPMV